MNVFLYIELMTYNHSEILRGIMQGKFGNVEKCDLIYSNDEYFKSSRRIEVYSVVNYATGKLMFELRAGETTRHYTLEDVASYLEKR